MTSRTEKNAQRSMFNVHPPSSIPVQRRGGRNSRERPSDRYNGADRSPKSNHASYRAAECLVASGQSTTTQPLRVRVEPHQSLQPTRDKEAHQLGQQTRFHPGGNHSGGRVGRRVLERNLHLPTARPQTERRFLPSQNPSEGHLRAQKACRRPLPGQAQTPHSAATVALTYAVCTNLHRAAAIRAVSADRHTADRRTDGDVHPAWGATARIIYPALRVILEHPRRCRAYPASRHARALSLTFASTLKLRHCQRRSWNERI